MPIIDVVNLDSTKVGSVDLPDEVFGCEVRPDLIHEAVIMQRACERQGTASTLRRGEVSGSGKKPWKQKHTGRARAGSLRSPVWRHGGTVFGPKPRSYSYAFPRKKYRAALQSALSGKVNSGQFVVLSELSLDEPKTNTLARSLDRLCAGNYVLLVVGKDQQQLMPAAQNIVAIKAVTVDQLNVYDVVRANLVLISQAELGNVKEVWS